MHVVLLGDSIFDNAAYVGGGPDVVRQLDERLGDGRRATLLAVDGAVVVDVHRQLARLPDDATHLVVSAGGNDALGHLSILNEPARSSAETLGRLASIAEGFENRYAGMVEGVRASGLPTVLCTIYYPAFPDERLQRLAVTALTVFNDVILRQAFASGLPVVDLRLVCDEPADYANPIEPSSAGGEKIAATIARVIQTHDFSSGRSGVYACP